MPHVDEIPGLEEVLEGHRQRLRAQPALIPGAIEEVLRYRSPVQSMYRAATGETELGGVVTRPGQPITPIPYEQALADGEAVYEESEERCQQGICGL